MTKPSARKRTQLPSISPVVGSLDLRSAKPAPKRADDFYLSPAWRNLVATIVSERGRRCEQCGRVGCRIFGDHFVELKDGGAALDRSNVQLLCQSCHGKKTAAARALRMVQSFSAKPRA